MNHELVRLVRELNFSFCQNEDDAIQLVSTLTGINLSNYKTAEEILRGLPVSCIQAETEKTRALLGKDKTLIPIIQIDDDHLVESIEAVRNGGANGVNFFLFDKVAICNMNNIAD